MSEVIVEQIRSSIKQLEPYRFTQKLIHDRNGIGLEMNKAMSDRYFEITGIRTYGIKRRDDPVQIQIIEELGEKALPLYIEKLSMLPGQRWVMRQEPYSDTDFYAVWDF